MAQIPPNQNVGTRRRDPAAFTLIELLVVISLVVVIATLAGPAMSSLQGANTLTKSVSDIGGLLEQARVHAMTKNTYVYVGMVELNDLNPTNNVAKEDGGRLAAAVLASKLGTRPSASSGKLDTNALVPVSRLLKFENLVLRTPAQSLGGMTNRVTEGSVVSFRDLSKAQDNQATVDWVASRKDGSITFDKVIEFSPEGVARVARSGNQDELDGCIEIPLGQARGTAANVAAIQVDGVTGAVRTYRP